MRETVTLRRVHADSPEYRRLPMPAVGESVEWLHRHGFDRDESCVFQVEYDVVDVPLIRVWWLTRTELHELRTDDIDRAHGDLSSLARVTETACRDLPSWWRPTGPALLRKDNT